jgi:hypothetical protein
VELGLDLLHQFQENHREIKIKVILADALYGESQFLDQATHLGSEVQVISQLQSIRISGIKVEKEPWRIILIPSIRVLFKLSSSEVNKKQGLGLAVRDSRSMLMVKSVL